MCPATRYLRDGGWRLGSRTCSGLSTVAEDRTIVVATETPLRTSAAAGTKRRKTYLKKIKKT